jgi:hypothetical protein
MQLTPVGTSAATGSVRGVFARGDTAAASFTCGFSSAFYAADPNKGAGSTITNLYGLIVKDQTVATNNYGVVSEVSSGTNKWNIYASGTAANYFAGNVGIGVTPTARNNTRLQIVDGIGFPATQVASSDANTLDDYEEGTWTPTFTWSTPGDQSFAYSTQVGTYTKVGRLVTCNVDLVTSTHTYTTAAGALQFTGLPFTVGATAYDVAAADWSGITKAGYTAIGANLATGGTTASLITSGSGVAVANVVPANVPSGTQVRFRATFQYLAA